MALFEKHLVVKKSTLPGAGKGLFTKKLIPRGTRIAEYKGKITTWKEVDHRDGLNAYIFYINNYFQYFVSIYSIFINGQLRIFKGGIT